MNNVKDYFERVRDMVRAIQLEQYKMQALEEGLYSIGGTNYNRVSSSSKSDFTDKMNAFLDKQMMYQYVKDAGLREYIEQVDNTYRQLADLKLTLKGNVLKGLFACEMIYLYDLNVSTTAEIFKCERKQIYEYRKAFMNYCEQNNLFID